MVGIIRDSLITPPVRQKRREIQVFFHTSLRLGILINLLASIVAPFATSTITALHVLDGVGWRAKTCISTNRAGDVTRTMNLLMHFKLILGVEISVAYYASIRRRRLELLYCCARRILRPRDAILAARAALALSPLIAAEVTTSAPIVTFCTVPSHIF